MTQILRHKSCAGECHGHRSLISQRSNPGTLPDLDDDKRSSFTLGGEHLLPHSGQGRLKTIGRLGQTF
ncbi:hypothetical protein TIFTF001_007153 [Ficus carica]|uniref:Uncharacterized protein n=1 Tax=Ficus carica TaxID=3494 RepID=A0AA87ZIU9_FICCA|nr:hypothetical protein TIFTF001_007153 [Ficus carica]